MTYEIRGYRDDDLTALIALHHAIAKSEGSERRVTAADLEEQLLAPGFDRFRQVLVATEGDRLVAERDLRVIWTRNEAYPLLESGGIVHPNVRAGDLNERMLYRAWQQGSEFVRSLGAERAICQCRCVEEDADARRTFESAGMAIARDNFTMVHSDLPSVMPGTLPDAVQLRPYRLGRDDQGWLQAWTEAFGDHWGQMSMTQDYWTWYIRRPAFFPEISIVAATGPNLDDIAGFCHCRIDGRPGAPTGRRIGMLRWVGVRRAWRRQGLGEALTRAGLIVLREAGAERVALGVDHGSWTGADRLYSRVGFTVAQRNLYYRRELDLAELTSAGQSDNST